MIEGTTPGATWVRDMFGRIAPRYDLLNHLLSMNIDRYWRARTVARVAHVLARPGARVLDVCCGTGDLMLALEAWKPAGGPAADQGVRPTERQERTAGSIVFGSDFCHPMLVAAGYKVQRRGLRAALFEADALQLPVGDASLDLVTTAFGFRNLANYRSGLEELLRVLKPGGVAAILEFSTPPNRVLAGLYGFYSRSILPAIGGLISGSRDAYTYLPESVRKFPGAPDLAGQMSAAGFGNVRFERMTAGIVALHIGERL
ncbi:MAG TPA: ubiquinone/menaquinone biosynthesis methyltransferase [Bryobacteraceae bacterium]|nr:ubiquinone/menaquinone biosynthesis methyltransferase [Bryobacteraceae bacterium]